MLQDCANGRTWGRDRQHALTVRRPSSMTLRRVSIRDRYITTSIGPGVSTCPDGWLLRYRQARSLNRSGWTHQELHRTPTGLRKLADTDHIHDTDHSHPGVVPPRPRVGPYCCWFVAPVACPTSSRADPTSWKAHAGQAGEVVRSELLCPG